MKRTKEIALWLRFVIYTPTSLVIAALLSGILFIATEQFCPQKYSTADGYCMPPDWYITLQFCIFCAVSSGLWVLIGSKTIPLKNRFSPLVVFFVGSLVALIFFVDLNATKVEYFSAVATTYAVGFFTALYFSKAFNKSIQRQG